MPKAERKAIANPRAPGEIWPREVLVAARRLIRLQTTRRRVARELKRLDQNIRLAKRELRAINTAALEVVEGEQTPPLRLFGESQG